MYNISKMYKEKICGNCGIEEELAHSVDKHSRIYSNLYEYPQGLLCRDCVGSLMVQEQIKVR